MKNNKNKLLRLRPDAFRSDQLDVICLFCVCCAFVECVKCWTRRADGWIRWSTKTDRIPAMVMANGNKITDITINYFRKIIRR